MEVEKNDIPVVSVNTDKPEKKKFSFKHYYHSNEEFRKRHLAKVMEKTTCICGRSVIKANMSKHKKTTIHNKLLNKEKLD